jgi:hypothetical protein
MADIFKEVVPSILQSKKDVLLDEHDEKDYNPYIVNRALSYHLDCILYVNQMNMNHLLDKKLQYHYLLNSIRQMKRKFQPWQKSETDKNLDCVKEYFGYSNSKAKEALRILSNEQIAYIKTKIEKGGVTK